MTAMTTRARLARWSTQGNGPKAGLRSCPHRARQRLQPSDLRTLVERVTRIELALSAWEADVLPLNYTRKPGPGGSRVSRHGPAHQVLPVMVPEPVG